MSRSWVLGVAVALGGCAGSARPPLVPTSLDAEQSRAEVSKLPAEISLEIVRLFTVRGFTLVEQRPVGAGPGVTMYFKGNRELLPTLHGTTVHANQIGSEFKVSIAQVADDHALVSIGGVATLNGVQVCPTYDAKSCRVEDELAVHVNGTAETDVVHGVVSELAVAGIVVPPSPGSPPPPPYDPYAGCKADRRRVLAEAFKLEDLRDRKAMIDTAPTCP
jgi:hypothetical protein